MEILPPRIVCLFDCDNTLLDNDRLKADMDAQLRVILGDARLDQFWAAYEAARAETEMVNYPMTIQKLLPIFGQDVIDQIGHIVWDYPFPSRLYPASLAVIQHIRGLGCAVGILSDGDTRYQPYKIAQSGLEAAVQGHVKIYVHKQAHVEEILRWLPGDHYVFVDDKATILGELKQILGQRATTIHIKQGHYSQSPGDPPPDSTCANIADLLTFGRDQLMP